MLIRRLKPEDANSISELHVLSFRNFFLTSLGNRFLAAFYKAVIAHKDGYGVGVFSEQNLVGFAIGTKRGKGFYKSVILSKGLSLFISALPNLISSPLKLTRILIGLTSSSSNVKYAEMPCLLSICVSPATTMKGLGSKLIKEFEKELIQNGENDVTLTTDKHNNEHVNQFYVRNGYICIDSFLQGKREMNFYHKKL